MAKRKTHEEYVAELAVKNPGVTVVGEYVGAHTKIDHLCPSCGEIWSAAPYKLISGRNKSCYACGPKQSTAFIKKARDQYIANLASAHPSVRLSGAYVDCRTNVAHQCAQGHQWEAAPTYLLKKKIGCPICAQKEKRPIKRKAPGKRTFYKRHKTYVREVRGLNKNLTVVGEYAGALRKIAHRCTLGHEWDATPNGILSGTGCPHCACIASAANVFYIWENIEDPSVYKVGVTSERLAEKRIQQSAREPSLTPRVILMTSTPHARDIERRALELGDNVNYPSTINGYTEFRRYSDAELGEVWRMAVGA